MIEHGGHKERDAVMQLIFEMLPAWSMHKYASNVVERCIQHATRDEIHNVVEMIMEPDPKGGMCPLLTMMKDQFGNYVVQRLMGKAEHMDRDKIATVVKYNAGYLKRFEFGKHVLQRVDKEKHQRAHGPMY